jgi:hypothetical protein
VRRARRAAGELVAEPPADVGIGESELESRETKLVATPKPPSRPQHHRLERTPHVCRVELEQSGFLSGDERREVVEGGNPPGLCVVPASGVRPIAERHTRLGAVVDKLHTRNRGLMHSHMWHRVRA